MKSLPPLESEAAFPPPTYNNASVQVGLGTPPYGSAHRSSASPPPVGAVPPIDLPASSGTLATDSITVDLAASVSPQFARYCADVPTAVASIKTELNRRLVRAVDHVKFVFLNGSTYLVSGNADDIQAIRPGLVPLLQSVADKCTLRSLPLDARQVEYLTADDSRVLKTMATDHPLVSFQVVAGLSPPPAFAADSKTGGRALATAAAARASSRPATTVG